MGGEEQALIYTLEEISGSDYCLQEDTLGGGSQVREFREGCDHSVASGYTPPPPSPLLVLFFQSLSVDSNRTLESQRKRDSTHPPLRAMVLMLAERV